jgi:hypothetical protein
MGMLLILTPMFTIESIPSLFRLPFEIISVVYATLGKKPPGKTMTLSVNRQSGL